MRLGDLVDWGGRRWIVRRHERGTRTVILHDGDQTEVLPDDLDKTKSEECQVIANPPNDWPFVAIMQRPKFGRLLNVARPEMVRPNSSVSHAQGQVTNLIHLQDWVVADPTQPGGALFFNPLLNLQLGDLLLGIYERGRARIQIPREFLSTREKIARVTAPSPEPPRISVYDRLRRNEFADDDE